MNVNLERNFEGLKLSELEMNMKNLTKEWLESLDESGWKLTRDLWKKFSPTGEILDFFGDTVVIPVSERVKELAENVQDRLYGEIGDLMSQRLEKEYFHITIHDLDNEFEDLSREDLERKMGENRRECERIFKALARYLEEHPSAAVIELRGVGMIGGFVAISIGFVPKSERDFNILMNLHSVFDEVAPLEKPYYPHLTLGYYRAVEFQREDLEKIKKTVMELNKLVEGVEISLNVWETSYQIFHDMNRYETILKLKEFRSE